MTVKEAIDELKYSRDMCYFDPSTGETGEPYDEDCERMAQALDIAIKALEIEPVCDCISRQRILDELDRVISIGIKGKDGRTPISAEIFRGFVEAEPQVKPEQKTFRWGKQILIDDGFGGKRVGYICLACKEYVPNKGNYCSNCGEKMESEEKQ